MGSTVPYGLRFPTAFAVPDVPADMRNLAEDVRDQLLRIDADVASLTGVVSTVATAASNVQVLGTINAGDGSNTTEFSGIDQNYRDLMIIWKGVSDGSGELDSLALRFNGDSGSNYHSRLSRNLANGDFMSTDGSGSDFTFTVLRAGYVGTHSSAGVIHIPGYSTTGTKLVTCTNIAVGQSVDDDIFNVQAGGRWSNTAAITAIRIWPSGQLWDGNPHITLLGIR